MTKKSKEVHQKVEAKGGSTNKAAAIIIILCFVGILPVLIWVTIPETSTYTSVTTTSPMVQTAAMAAGLQICSQDPIIVKVPGATSAVLYSLAPSCSTTTPATTVQVLTVGFSSSDAQSAAIANAQATYYNWQSTNTAAFTSGYTVIVVQGAPANPAVEQISASLIDQGAVRIL